MKNFSRFSFPTTIVYGAGAVSEAAACIKELRIAKPLVVTDQPLVQTEAFRRLRSVLERRKVPYALFSGVHPNPLDSDVEAALEQYRAERCDAVLAVGGGSPLDTGKALAVLAACGGRLADYDVQQGGGERIKGPLPPVLAVPTTAGTGSEAGKCAVITSSSKRRKFMVCHPEMMPRRAILDPELTVSLPPHLTAYTGMDALTHNIESLTAPIFHPMCDAIALKGIEFAAASLERCVTHPEDLEARGRMQLAATMGAVAFQKDLGAAHSLSHALSAVCGLQHGLANAVCLVPVMRYNLDAAEEHYARIAPCFGVDTCGLPTRKAAEAAVERIGQLARRIGIAGSLKEVGVKQEQFDEIAGKAFLDPCHLTNVKPCTEADLHRLLKESWRGA